MARTRSLKPSFFEHDGIGDLDFPVMVLFEALWLLADRDGRLLDRPRKIRGFAFRFKPQVTNEMVDEWLDVLANHPDRFIQRYEVAGEKIIQVTGFREHQSPHPKEATDDLPPPPDDVSRETPGNFTASPEISRQDEKSPGRSVDRKKRERETRNQEPETKDQQPATSNQPGEVEPKARARPTKRCPPDFELTDERREWAARETGIMRHLLPAIFAEMRDHEFATARTDWDAVWRNWCRKHIQRNPRDKDPYAHLPRTPVAIVGGRS